MKKFLSIVLLTCAATTFLNAQKAYLWGTAGLNASSFLESQPLDKSSVIGPQFALSLRAKYPNHWGYEAGIFYAAKGANYNTLNQKVRLDYAGAYINGMFNFELENNNTVYVGAGFYFAGALKGEIKNDSTTVKINYDNNWKNYDIGIQMKAGYNINNLISLSLHYDVGFTKIYIVEDSRGKQNKADNSTVSINAGFNLSKLLGHKK